MPLFHRALSAVFASTVLCTSFAFSQTKPTEPKKAPKSPQSPKVPPKPDQGKPGATPAGGPHFPAGFAPGGPKPYDEVVTKDAKSQDGLFKVHRIKDQVLFEIPKELLKRELMTVVTLAKIPSTGGMFAPGLPGATSVFKFEKHDDTLYMREPNYSERSTNEQDVAIGLEHANVDPIVGTFAILAYGKDGSMVVDATRLFTTDPSEFPVKGVVNGAGVDPSRSYLASVTAFPQNIEVESQLTFIVGGGRGGSSAATTLVHYSLDLLPATPMQPRLKDSRIGYFSTPFTLYDGLKNSETVAYIDRFRLEKKDPSAAISEPKKAIVFYIGRDVPAKWKPYLRQGVEAWQPAFESAGFKNAIIAKDAPTEAEDPKFDPLDIRNNVISWTPSTIANAEGLHISDPRSGESLYGHVVLWHDVVKLSQDWYFCQAGASDPRAQTLPLPDDLGGEILRYIVTHEVGHVLGLEHNFKASSAFSVAQLRDKAFTEANGDEASVMDYGRFNYVAQPGDGARLIPKLGPYDYFAIKYGYSAPFASSPDGEKSALDRILAEQVSNPMVRFGNSRFDDPTIETEDLGSDPVAASTLGLKNIDRVASMLLPATVKYGEDYSKLSDTYQSLTGQRFLELLHVTKLVGGVVETDYHGGRGGNVFSPVPKAKQKEAVHFLVTKGLNLSKALMNPNILDKIQSTGSLDQASAMPRVLLSTLFTDSRVNRMFNNEAENGDNAYTVAEMLSDVRSGVWQELSLDKPVINIYRRNLQDQYLKAMDDHLNGPSATRSQFRGLARMDLKALRASILKDLPKTKDYATKAHLMDASDTIKDILDGKTPPAPAPRFSLQSLLGGFRFGLEGEPVQIEGVTD